MEITVQDNPLNRKEFEVNEVFTIEGQSWSVLEIDYTRRGVLGVMMRSKLS